MGLIILFIKVQYSDQVLLSGAPGLQAFAGVAYLNLIVLPASSFVSSPIRLFHDSRSSLHQQRSLCIQSSQVQTYVLIVRSGCRWPTRQRPSSSSQCPDFHLVHHRTCGTDKADVRIREKS